MDDCGSSSGSGSGSGGGETTYFSIDNRRLFMLKVLGVQYVEAQEVEWTHKFDSKLGQHSSSRSPCDAGKPKAGQELGDCPHLDKGDFLRAKEGELFSSTETGMCKVERIFPKLGEMIIRWFRKKKEKSKIILEKGKIVIRREQTQRKPRHSLSDWPTRFTHVRYEASAECRMPPIYCEPPPNATNPTYGDGRRLSWPTTHTGVLAARQQMLATVSQRQAEKAKAALLLQTVWRRWLSKQRVLRLRSQRQQRQRQRQQRQQRR
jgi:hypothetical protein